MQLDHDFLHWQFTCFLVTLLLFHQSLSACKDSDIVNKVYCCHRCNIFPKTPSLSCDVFSFNPFMARSSHRLAWVADGFLGCFTCFIGKVKRTFLRPLPHRFLVQFCLLLYGPQTKNAPKNRHLRWLREKGNHKLCNLSIFLKRKENGRVLKISKRSLPLKIGSHADSLKSCYFLCS